MNEIDREYHPVSNIFPLMEGDDFNRFKADIQANGLQESIWIDQDGRIIDGRNRHRACIETNVPPKFRTYNGDDPTKFVISLNLHRRHLNESQRGVVAERLSNIPKHYHKVDTSIDVSITQNEAAELLNVSVPTIQRIASIKREAPEFIPLIEKGEITANKAVTEMRRKQVIERLDDIQTKEVKTVAGVFDVIVIDPPWPIVKIERDVAPNQVALEYPTMTIEQISEMLIPTADDCHVWLWTTQKYLPASFSILERWGLKYVCTFVWHKNGGFQPFGLPQYNAEFALYARKGTPIFTDLKDFKLCFKGERGSHSEKPDEFYQLVRRVTAGRRLDMFNRRTIDGFETWGNEAC